MGKSNTKSHVKTKSSKATTKETNVKSPMNSPLKGSLGRFLGFFIPGMGFGGAFLIISILILSIFFWVNQNVFLGNVQEWNVVFNPPPSVWERVDILQEVQKNQHELFERPYEDTNLLEDLSNAFNLVVIVKKVNSVVRHYPNQIILDLDYFVPVCMVHVYSTITTPGYFPVDKDGYVLPTRPYFKVTDVKDYITIHGINSIPVNNVGQKWGDIRVELAAKIAQELIPYKEEFAIVNILVHEGNASKNSYYNPTLFDVELSNKTYIRWSTVIIQQNGEPLVQDTIPLEEKIDLLREQKRKGNGVITADAPNKILSFESIKKK